MAPVEMTPLVERPSGIAFEVLVKSSAGAAAITPGRLRLESYGAGAASLPRLLRREHRAGGAHEAVKRCAAEKSPQSSARPAGATEQWGRLVHMQARVARPKPAPRESPSTAVRQLRARSHNEAVSRRVAGRKSATAAHVERLRQKLMRPLAPPASIRERCEKARLHNERVARNLQERNGTTAEEAMLLEGVMREKPEPLDSRRQKAFRHNSEVLRKRVEHRRVMTCKAEALAVKLAQRSMANEAKALSVKRRCEKAMRHNREVTRRMEDRRSAGMNAVDRPHESASACSMEEQLKQARQHNEAVALAAERHEQQTRGSKVSLARQQPHLKADAHSRRVARMASRTTRARMHNDAAKRKVAETRAARDRRRKPIIEKLEKKATAAALIREVRRGGKRAHGVLGGAGAAGEAAGTPAVLADAPHRRRFSTLPSLLVMLLPCC